MASISTEGANALNQLTPELPPPCQASGAAITAHWELRAGDGLCALATLPAAAAADLALPRAGAEALGIMRALGGQGVRLLAAHRTWDLVPNGNAKDHLPVLTDLQPRVLEQIRVDLTRLEPSAAVDDSRVVFQIVGAAISAGGYPSLRSLTAEVRLAGPVIGSHKSLLQEWAAKEKRPAPTYVVVDQHGPDHEKVWTVRASVAQLAATATASTKKAAEEAAARTLLKQSAEHVLTSRAKLPIREAPVVLPHHRNAIRDLAKSLGLSADAAPLLSAGLTQRGHAGDLPRPNRDAAGGLAQLGADAVTTYVLRLLMTALSEGVGVADVTVAQKVCSRRNLAVISERLGIRAAMVRTPLSNRQAEERLTADGLQAVAAVLLLDGGDLESLRRFTALHDALAFSVARAVRRRPDELLHPKPRLQQALSAFGFGPPTYRVHETQGRPHEARHTVRLELTSASGSTYSLLSAPRESRKAAEEWLARTLLQALELPGGALESKPARRALRFILEATAEQGLQLPRDQRARGALPGAVGAIARGDWEQADAWLGQLLAVADEGAVDRWREFVSGAVGRESQRALDEIADWLAGLVDEVGRLNPDDQRPALNGSPLEAQLLSVASVARLLSAPRERRSSADIIDEVRLLRARRGELLIADVDDAVFVERPGSTVSFVTAALDAATEGPCEISALLDGRRISFRVRGTLRAEAHGVEEALSHDLPLLAFQYGKEECRWDWLADPSPELASALTGPSAVNPRVAVLAAELHDLKNRLAAHDAALGRKGATDTDRRRAAYEASRHLDSAREICQSLLGHAGATRSAQADAIDVGALLDEYIGDLLARRPRNIAVDVPALPSCQARTNAALLRAAIDNLVKNAIEAMPRGGRLGIELEVAQKIRIAVTDTGGGFQPDQLVALEGGDSIASTKRAGSGLGVASVRTAMRRLGGSLLLENVAEGARVTMLLTNGGGDEDLLG